MPDRQTQYMDECRIKVGHRLRNISRVLSHILMGAILDEGRYLVHIYLNRGVMMRVILYV